MTSKTRMEKCARELSCNDVTLTSESRQGMMKKRPGPFGQPGAIRPRRKMTTCINKVDKESLGFRHRRNGNAAVMRHCYSQRRAIVSTTRWRGSTREINFAINLRANRTD